MKKTYETAKVIYDLLTSKIRPVTGEVFVHIDEEYYSVSKFCRPNWAFKIESDFIKTNNKYEEINRIVSKLTKETEESNKRMIWLKEMQESGVL